MPFKAVVMKFAGLQLSFFFLLLREGWSKGGCKRLSLIPSRRVQSQGKSGANRNHTCPYTHVISVLAIGFPQILIQLVRGAFTRSFYSYQLLVMVIKYIPGARH